MKILLLSQGAHCSIAWSHARRAVKTAAFMWVNGQRDAKSSSILVRRLATPVARAAAATAFATRGTTSRSNTLGMM